MIKIPDYAYQDILHDDESTFGSRGSITAAMKADSV